MQALEGKPLTVSNLQTVRPAGLTSVRGSVRGFVNDKSEIFLESVLVCMYVLLVSINKKRSSNY